VVAGHLHGTAPEEAPPVAVAFPGPFDYAASVPRLTHKYAALAGVRLDLSIRAALPRAVGPIRFVNDAAAAGAGVTAALGTDRPPTVLVVTLGTGLGSSLFDGLRLVEEREGITVENLWTRYHDGMEADRRFSASGLASALEVDPSRLPEMVAAAGQEPGVAAVLRAWGADFGRFLAPLTAALGAGLVLVGGGASAAFAWFGPALAEALPSAVTVRRADHSATAPVLGAAILTVPRPGPG
jgi:predicted NBD/HSP70 family sugar kinase